MEKRDAFSSLPVLLARAFLSRWTHADFHVQSYSYVLFFTLHDEQHVGRVFARSRNQMVTSWRLHINWDLFSYLVAIPLERCTYIRNEHSCSPLAPASLEVAVALLDG